MESRLLTTAMVLVILATLHQYWERLAAGLGLAPDTAYSHVLRREDTSRVRADRWLEARARARHNAVTVTGRRYGETGAFAAGEVRAAAFRIPVAAGEQLRVALPMVAPAPGDLLGELYRARGDRWEPVQNLRHGRPVVMPAAEEQQDYLLLLQPRSSHAVHYRLEISRGGSLPFPVANAGVDRIWSFFGDARANGARLHEGVDVFVDRGTVVHAVVDGYVRTTVNPMGGKVVWLIEAGTGIRYYYAHLDTIAVPHRVRVRQGAVLGTVGNTGNARTTPPHLHFGIYLSPRRAVDPLPYLQPPPERDFLLVDMPATRPPVLGQRQVTADWLNLRAGPEKTAEIVGKLRESSTVQVVAAAHGPWKRVQLGDGRAGFVHRDWLTTPVADDRILAAGDDEGQADSDLFTRPRE
ncbi:MAG: peptidoglycan DD-metalloendopeptidase family protein [Aquisalimonadaceae bacterium]